MLGDVITISGCRHDEIRDAHVVELEARSLKRLVGDCGLIPMINRVT